MVAEAALVTMWSPPSSALSGVRPVAEPVCDLRDGGLLRPLPALQRYALPIEGPLRLAPPAVATGGKGCGRSSERDDRRREALEETAQPPSSSSISPSPISSMFTAGGRPSRASTSAGSQLGSSSVEVRARCDDDVEVWNLGSGSTRSFTVARFSDRIEVKTINEQNRTAVAARSARKACGLASIPRAAFNASQPPGVVLSGETTTAQDFGNNSLTSIPRMTESPTPGPPRISM